MDEKVLIKSEKYNLVKLVKILVIIGIIASVIMFIVLNADVANYYDRQYNKHIETYLEHEEKGACYFYIDDVCYDCEWIEENPSKIGYVFSSLFENLVFSLIPVAAMGLISALIYFMFRSYELTVTDKRIYGKVAFGKRVDLPVDSVSATATIQLLKGVAVSTSSGKISFLAIKNANDIYSVINKLLIERQKEKANVSPTTSPVSNDIEKLKEFKELLDMGAITQEEFDEKKKQLLNL